jgi:lipopolysaccharide transport protein LptA
MVAEGSVQSAVYNAKQKQKGRDSDVPVYATAQTMTYDRDSHLIQYRNNVDIRQGTDRMTSALADIYLDDRNELSKTVAETNVVITQVGRRATGDWATYSASEDVSVLRGSPATIVDEVNGTTQAAELTFNMRENRGIAEAKVKPQTSGRIRSTYKIQPKH